MDSVLEEVKSATRESVETKRRELEQLLEEAQSNLAAAQSRLERTREMLRDVLLELVSVIRTNYQITVAEARAVKSVEEIAELWKGTRAFYSMTLGLWKGVEAKLDAKSPQAELFQYLSDLIRKLERASAQAYEFYPSEQAPTAVFELCEEGGYHAFLKEVPGVHTQGETIEEARENLADAFREMLAYRIDEKLGASSSDRL
jgi:predicted RNase H-like HicB family nuclease